MRSYAHIGHLGHDGIHDLYSRERQRTLLQYLGRALARGVLHGHDHAARASNQVHGPAHAFDHLAGDHPVGEIALLIDFHGAKHAQINVPTADHGKRIGAGKICRAGNFRDCLFAGIDEVRVFFSSQRIRPHAQHSILTLQDDMHALRHAVGNQGRQPDAQVDVEAVAQLAGDALNNALPLLHVFLSVGFG